MNYAVNTPNSEVGMNQAMRSLWKTAKSEKRHIKHWSRMEAACYLLLPVKLD